MKIKVKEIPRDGLVINETLSAQELGLIDDDLRVLSPMVITGEVRRSSDTLIADVEVQAKYEFSCIRCLESVIRDRRDEFKIYIDIEPKTEIVDLGDEIRQEILVSVSPLVLCKEDCKGSL